MIPEMGIQQSSLICTKSMSANPFVVSQDDFQLQWYFTATADPTANQACTDITVSPSL